MRRESIRKLLRAVVVAYVLNFAAFAVGTFVLHGDALSARWSCPPGNYVDGKDGCHPVSHAAYVYSKVTSYSLVISAPFLFAAALTWKYKKAAEQADAQIRSNK